LNLTKKSIEALTVRAKRYNANDDRVAGLGVAVYPSGVKSFFWYRRINGQLTWKTLGSVEELSVEQARTRAQELNVGVADWKSRGYDGPNPIGRPTREPTLNEIIEDYCDKRLLSHAKKPEKAAKDVRWARDKYIGSLKNQRLSNITRNDVRELHRVVGTKHGHVTANRMVTLLKTVFNWAKKTHDWTGNNPAEFIEKFHETPRSRSLQPDEIKTFIEALANEPNRDLRDFLVISVFTGARRSDILSLRWQDISFGSDPPVWLVPEPKNRRPLRIALMPEVIERLEERRNDSPWVFPSARGESGHLVTIKKGYRTFTERAGLKNLHVHDLRRTHGTLMEEAGVPLSIISKVLGHSSTAVTERYLAAGKKSRDEAVRKGTRVLKS
jgi:integrase